jgi:hypothetical protein
VHLNVLIPIISLNILIELKSKPISFFSLTVLVLALFSLAASFSYGPVLAQPSKPLVVIIVDSFIHRSIEESLNQYIIDIERSGFAANITGTDQLPDKTPNGIRAYLLQAQNQNLIGALLIGNVSEAWFETQDHKFPSDMFYMDLDGYWFDMDRDGIYDARGGDLAPEIWVGRLKVSTLSSDSALLVNNYFAKNHAYRTGAISVPWWRSLIYIDNQGTFNKLEAKASLSYITTDTNLVSDPDITNTTDYKNRLKDPVGFNWLYLMSHGESRQHSFYVLNRTSGALEIEGTIDSSDYETIDPRILFYQFFTCSASRYTDQNYLAGTVVFKTSWGLAALGSTDDIYTFSMDPFFKSLSEGTIVGEAFKQLLDKAVEQNKYDYYTDLRYQILFNALTITGDPTLALIRENHDVAITNLTATLKNETGTETLIITATAENKGEFDEKVRIEISYDSLVVFSVDLVMRVAESTTVTFSPVDSYEFIWGTHTKHLIQAKVSITSGEFNLGNNEGVTYFEGRIIEVDLPLKLPAYLLVIVVNVGLGLVSFLTLRQLMSERPGTLLHLKNLYKFLKRKFLGSNNI